MKKTKVILFVFFILIFIEIVIAIGTYTINKSVYSQNENMIISLSPDSQGFYKYVYVMKNVDVVDTVTVDCNTICLQFKQVNYQIPSSFLGDYSLAIFDYNINDYIYLPFSVVESPAIESTTLQYNISIRAWENGTATQGGMTGEIYDKAESSTPQFGYKYLTGPGYGSSRRVYLEFDTSVIPKNAVINLINFSFNISVTEADTGQAIYDLTSRPSTASAPKIFADARNGSSIAIPNPSIKGWRNVSLPAAFNTLLGNLLPSGWFGLGISTAEDNSAAFGTAGEGFTIYVNYNITLKSINLDLLSPMSNISVPQYEIFNVTLNISCPYSDCGKINVSLAINNINTPQSVIQDVNAIYHGDTGLYSRGDSTTLSAGTTGQNTRRAVVDFNTSSIPSDAIISSAILQIYVFNRLDANPVSINEMSHPISYYANDDSGNTALFADAGSGTIYNNTFVPPASEKFVNIALLNGITTLQNQLSQGWFGLGFEDDSSGFSFNSSDGRDYGPTLFVTYTSILSGIPRLISTEIGAIPMYTNITNNPWPVNLNKGLSQIIIFWVNVTGNPGNKYTLVAFANQTSNLLISNITKTFSVEITPVIGSINIKDNGGVEDLLVNPIAGKNSDIEITSILSGYGCENYNVNAYLCKQNREICSDVSYDYAIPLGLNTSSMGRCEFLYRGNQSTPEFWQNPGEWEIYVKAIGTRILDNSAKFTYNQLKAVFYPASVDFKNLIPLQWNSGLPSDGIDIINQGNTDLDISWMIERFSCISPGCNDAWILQGNDLQIDDDSIHGEAVETGFSPRFVSSVYNIFPQEQKLKKCILNSCNNGIGERIKTYYHLNPAKLSIGTYRGEINIEMN